jgi:hypothetical protein
MQFSNEGGEWVGSEEGRRALSAGGDEMTHPCGPDVYQGVCDIEMQGDRGVQKEIGREQRRKK